MDLDPSPAEGELGTVHQAIGGNWRAFTQLPTQQGGFAGDSAICDAHTGTGNIVIFGRSASTNRFRMSIVERLWPATAWANIGTQTFNSKPACAALDGPYDLPQNLWNYQKAILGKSSSSNRYMVRVMKLPPPPPSPDWPPPPISPTVIQNWVSISTATYDSAPAATVATGFGGGTLVVCGRRTNNRLYCHRNPLDISNVSNPFNNGNWQPIITVPALPTGWTAQGDPALADTTPWTGSLTIATRATSSTGQTRIWYTMWFDGSQFNVWQQFPTVAAGIAGDPAMSIDIYHHGASLFFRGGDNRIYEGSGIGSLGWALAPINSAANTNSGWAGAPSAVGSLNGWEGGHAVIARKMGQFYMTGPCPVQGGC